MANLEAEWGLDLNVAQDLSLPSPEALGGTSDAPASQPSGGSGADVATPVRWQPPRTHYFGADGAYGPDGIGGANPTPDVVQEVVVTGRRHTPWWEAALDDLGAGFRLAGDFAGGAEVGAGSEVRDMARGLASLGWNGNPIGFAASDLVHLGVVNGNDVPSWVPDSDRIIQPVERLVGDLVTGRLDPGAQFSWLNSWRDTAKQGPDAVAFRAGDLFGHGAALVASSALGGAAGAAGDAADAGRLGEVAAEAPASDIEAQFLKNSRRVASEAHDDFWQAVGNGSIPVNPKLNLNLQAGKFVDDAVRRSNLSLRDELGLGPDRVRINQRLYTPDGGYSVPDLHFPESGNIIDYSYQVKSLRMPQVQRFLSTSPNGAITIVPPAQVREIYTLGSKR